MAKIVKPFNTQTHLGCNNSYNRFLMIDVERLNRKYYLITLTSNSSSTFCSKKDILFLFSIFYFCTANTNKSS